MSDYEKGAVQGIGCLLAVALLILLVVSAVAASEVSTAFEAARGCAPLARPLTLWPDWVAIGSFGVLIGTAIVGAIVKEAAK